jgi:hypothetical protein
MKKLALIFLGLNLNAYCQTIGVEKTFFSIQTGLAGIWINNETKLSNSIALRSEIELNMIFLLATNMMELDLQPVLTLEPRYYYNLENRNSEEKNIKK